MKVSQIITKVLILVALPIIFIQLTFLSHDKVVEDIANKIYPAFSKLSEMNNGTESEYMETFIEEVDMVMTQKNWILFKSIYMSDSIDTLEKRTHIGYNLYGRVIYTPDFESRIEELETDLSY